MAMIGAIIGDIVGSRFEFSNFKSKEFELFHKDCDYTDDTICTIATADWLLRDDQNTEQSYAKILQDWCRKYPHPKGGYGGRFHSWIYDETRQPYRSYGNGSAMRVSPVGWIFSTIEKTIEVAATSAKVSHDHTEGIKGAQATSAAIFLARNGNSKEQIKNSIETQFGYDLNRTVEEIRPIYKYNETCQRTVPEAIISFLDSTDFEDAIRNAISLGGDADTLTCITGAIAEAYYGTSVLEVIAQEVFNRLPQEFSQIILRFYNDRRN
ncbi:ADP-ribosylglycohydrolase family protein [Maribellus sediminis]|uniref:ADP-ribosylglycohydrolase family protein n=1 Tax=Maribellus sediminis TaxID=2696285 RepID=UPI00197F5166|nr:ADP-ribosylglycohydrolase family protein [Maribellus sediminis]